MADTLAHPTACLSCGKDEGEIPLVVLRYAGKEIHICPHCLPVLIHHTERLAEKLTAA